MPVLLKWADKGLRIVGPEDASSDARAPTIAFVLVDAQGNHRVGTSKAIHQALVRSAIGAQQGHMYAHKLVSSLGLDLADGVIRLSFVHYKHRRSASHRRPAHGHLPDTCLKARI